MVLSFLNQFLDSKFFNDPTPGHESIRLILLIIVIYGGILIGLIASCIYMRDTKQGSTLSKEQRAEMELHRKKSVQFQTEFEFEKRKTTKKVGVRQRSKSEFEVSQSSFGDCIVDTLSGKFTPISKTKLKHINSSSSQKLIGSSTEESSGDGRREGVLQPLEAMNSLDENNVPSECGNSSNHNLGGQPFMGNGMKINKFSADEIDRLLDDGNTPDINIDCRPVSQNSMLPPSTTCI